MDMKFKKQDFLVIPGTIFSPLSVLPKCLNNPLFKSKDAIAKAYNDGLYHFTSNTSADKIVESKVLYPSNNYDSYGVKKCFFFSGIPDIETLCMNKPLSPKMTAVKIKLPYEKLVNFNQRSLNDNAVLYNGELDLNNAIVEKVRLVLKENNGNLYMDEVSEEEYKNYKLNISEENMKIINSKLANNIKQLCISLRKELTFLKEDIVKFIKSENGLTDLRTREQLEQEWLDSEKNNKIK